MRGLGGAGFCCCAFCNNALQGPCQIEPLRRLHGYSEKGLSMSSRTLCLPFLLGVVALSARADTPLTTIRVASGLSSPLFAGSPPGDLQRVFILEQNSGKIKILKNGVVLPTEFLNIKTKIF